MRPTVLLRHTVISSRSDRSKDSDNIYSLQKTGPAERRGLLLRMKHQCAYKTSVYYHIHHDGIVVCVSEIQIHGICPDHLYAA